MVGVVGAKVPMVERVMAPTFAGMRMVVFFLLAWRKCLNRSRL
jgi:hypothetical protein